MISILRSSLILILFITSVFFNHISSNVWAQQSSSEVSIEDNGSVTIIISEEDIRDGQPPQLVDDSAGTLDPEEIDTINQFVSELVSDAQLLYETSNIDRVTRTGGAFALLQFDAKFLEYLHQEQTTYGSEGIRAKVVAGAQAIIYTFLQVISGEVFGAMGFIATRGDPAGAITGNFVGGAVAGYLFEENDPGVGSPKELTGNFVRMLYDLPAWSNFETDPRAPEYVSILLDRYPVTNFAAELGFSDVDAFMAAGNNQDNLLFQTDPELGEVLVYREGDLVTLSDGTQLDVGGLMLRMQLGIPIPVATESIITAMAQMLRDAYNANPKNYPDVFGYTDGDDIGRTNYWISPPPSYITPTAVPRLGRVLDFGGGDDTILAPGFDTPDWIDGGLGVDTVEYGTGRSGVRGNRIEIDLQNGYAVIDPQELANNDVPRRFAILENVENVTGDFMNFTIRGTLESNRFEIFRGTNDIDGRGGKDIFVQWNEAVNTVHNFGSESEIFWRDIPIRGNFELREDGFYYHEFDGGMFKGDISNQGFAIQLQENGDSYPGSLTLPDYEPGLYGINLDKDLSDEGASLEPPDTVQEDVAEEREIRATPLTLPNVDTVYVTVESVQANNGEVIFDLRQGNDISSFYVWRLTRDGDDLIVRLIRANKVVNLVTPHGELILENFFVEGTYQGVRVITAHTTEPRTSQIEPLELEDGSIVFITQGDAWAASLYRDILYTPERFLDATGYEEVAEEPGTVETEPVTSQSLIENGYEIIDASNNIILDGDIPKAILFPDALTERYVIEVGESQTEQGRLIINDQVIVGQVVPTDEMGYTNQRIYRLAVGGDVYFLTLHMREDGNNSFAFLLLVDEDAGEAALTNPMMLLNLPHIELHMDSQSYEALSAGNTIDFLGITDLDSTIE